MLLFTARIFIFYWNLRNSRNLHSWESRKPLHAPKLAKILDMFKCPEKLHFPAAVFLDRFFPLLQEWPLCVFIWFFLGLTFYFGVGQLSNLSETLKQNLFWFNGSTLEMLSMALMSNHRKRMRKFLWWSFFTGNEGTPNWGISKNGQNHKLGDAPASPLHQQPLGLQTFKLCFLSTIEICINLERLYLNFCCLLYLYFSFKHHHNNELIVISILRSWSIHWNQYIRK